jgi:DNA primase
VCGFRGGNLQSLFSKLNVAAQFFTELQSIGHFIGDLTTKNEEHIQKPALPAEFNAFYNSKPSIEYRNALNYIRSRGVEKNDILRYHIGYCEDGPYKNRIVIPSYAYDGELNFFSARDYYGTSRLSYTLSPTSKDIIGFESMINFDEPITLVEGQFDAMALRFNAIPLFGKTMSMKLKLKLIESDTPKVNVVLDNDALKEAVSICKYLMDHGIRTHLVQLDGKDPSTLGFEQSWKMINSTPEFDFSSLIKTNLSTCN